jgi:DNA sulfur modification protein DndC
MRTLSLFDNERLSLERSIELSAESLRHYGSLYKHWAIAFSGGKDSSATVTLVVDLIEKGQIPKAGEPDGALCRYPPGAAAPAQCGDGGAG